MWIRLMKYKFDNNRDICEMKKWFKRYYVIYISENMYHVSPIDIEQWKFSSVKVMKERRQYPGIVSNPFT